jgi:hypothetical protein
MADKPTPPTPRIVPPPRASPRIFADRLEPIEDEAKTDPRMHAALARHDNKLTLRSVAIAAGTLATGIAMFFVFIDARIAHATDAGVRVQAAELKAVDARVTTMEKRLDRVDDKLDLLLDAARVPTWKRPPPLDGGSP